MSFVGDKPHSKFTTNESPYNLFKSYIKGDNKDSVESIKRPNGEPLAYDFQPEAVKNNFLLKSKGIVSNHEYRNYMIDKGSIIRDYNTRLYKR